MKFSTYLSIASGGWGVLPYMTYTGTCMLLYRVGSVLVCPVLKMAYCIQYSAILDWRECALHHFFSQTGT